MRVLLCGIVAAALAFAQAPQVGQAPAAGTMSLTGRVITGTGQEARPVRRARVTLLGRGGDGARMTDTDTKGGYRFDRVPAGDHKVAVEKPGFVKLEADAAPSGTLTMERAGAIEGVVTDGAGDPLMNALVAALQLDRVSGKPKRIAQSRTDDLGRYRLHSLAPGDYFVEANTDTLAHDALLLAGEKRPDGKRSYYPAGAATLEEGRTVRVSVGRDASGIDLALMPPTPARDPAAPSTPARTDQTGTARIAGRVMDAASGRPIKGARLLLLPTEGQRLTNWTRSDAQGRFQYTSLPVRGYTLRVEAERFVTLEYGQKRPGETGTPIQITVDGQDFKADVALPRASAVEGKLLDEFGDPVPNVIVQMAGKQYVAGRQRLMPLGSRLTTAPSDDRGYYRISGVTPGEYHLAALTGVYTDQNEVGGFAPTYFPGTTDAGAAVPVTVPFGADTTTSFALAPARTVSVAGTMVDASGQPVGRGTLMLNPPDREQRMDFNVARAVTAPDGTFMLRNVPTGTYTLQGFGPPLPALHGAAAGHEYTPLNLGAMRFGWLALTVGDSDVEGVVLKVTGGTFLRGRISFEDEGAARPKPDMVRVTAIPVEFDSAPIGGGPPPSKTAEDWTFEVTNMSGLRRVFASVAAPGWALKKITLNDRDVTDTPLDLRTKDVEGIDVVLTSKVSNVSGSVSDDRGPVLDYALVIFSSDPTKWIDRSRFVALGRPNQFGRFELRGLPPEDYLAVALTGVVQTEWMSPEFLQQVRPLATRFVLQEGETKTLELKLKKRPI
jgi:protocatechuate 3,4-dioxygenase beta subunit